MTTLLPGLSRPVGSVYCLGKNYRKHAIEMGQTTPRPPVIFLKPAAAVVPMTSLVPLPVNRGEVHHEVEMVIAVGEDHEITHVAVGLDLTLRDEQSAAKAAGEPWSASKGFPGSGWVSEFVPRPPRWDDLALSLEVNGDERQAAPLSEMTLDPEASVRAVAAAFPLVAGDLIFTGTPEGVGPLVSGDHVRVRLSPAIDVTRTVP